MSGDMILPYLAGLGIGWALVVAIALIAGASARVKASRRDWDRAFEEELEGTRWADALITESVAQGHGGRLRGRDR
ncbi:MAG: hypothetical protein M3214_15250 [Actinomycetota bacterium]|nr:hypothetical protein [Actinomycetota bacterium]